MQLHFYQALFLALYRLLASALEPLYFFRLTGRLAKAKFIDIMK